jgi:hypothetical protein
MGIMEEIKAAVERSRSRPLADRLLEIVGKLERHEIPMGKLIDFSFTETLTTVRLREFDPILETARKMRVDDMVHSRSHYGRNKVTFTLDGIEFIVYSS